MGNRRSGGTKKKTWEDTEETSNLYELISQHNFDVLNQWFTSDSSIPFLRSKDGRGPMFWAYEFGHKDIIKLLKSMGVSDSQKDKDGYTAKDVIKNMKK